MVSCAEARARTALGALERAVAERTAELKAANEKLEEEVVLVAAADGGEAIRGRKPATVGPPACRRGQVVDSQYT